MASQPQLPTFSLELKGDMKANWEHFYETFESYTTLMGYRDTDRDGKKVPGNSAKELAALKYCLPKEARTVLMNSITWANDEDQNDPALNLRKLGLYYKGTKNIIHERVEINRMFRLESEPINHWETRCQEQAVNVNTVRLALHS